MRTSLSGDTLEPCPAVPDSNQSPPHPGSQSNILATPPLPDYLANEDQNRLDHFQPHITHSHYRSHQTRHDQERPSGPFDNENKDDATAEKSVVVRTTTLVPSSPLLKSTVMDSPASEALSHRHPQSEYLIQADPKSPYYTFQDTRLIPNPIIRIYMANSTDPKMFSLQNISPDTLSLLLPVFISSSKEVADLVVPF